MTTKEKTGFGVEDLDVNRFWRSIEKFRGNLSLEEFRYLTMSLLFLKYSYSMFEQESQAGKKGPIRAVEKGETEAYFLKNARGIKKAATVPVICVGGWRTPALIEEALKSNAVDAVAMSRPLIAEPDLASRWRAGDPSPAKCISCNGCFAGGLKGEGIYCKQKAKGKI